MALRVDLVGSILEQSKSKYDTMRKLRLSDAQMEDFERHEAVIADMQDAEDINMQIIQSSTMEHIRNGGSNGSKQVTASDYREMLNQSLFSTINVDEDYFTATANDVDKARTYLSFCGLKATILERWLDVDGHSISSLRSNVASSDLPEEDLQNFTHNPSIGVGLVLPSHATLGPSQRALIATMQATNTSGFPIVLARNSNQPTLAKAAQVTEKVSNGVTSSGPLTPGPTAVPQALREEAVPTRRGVRGAPEDLGSQMSSPNISYGIDPAIARGHVYNTPIRSIDGLVQPRGRTSYTGSARPTVPGYLPGPTPRHSSRDMTEPLYSYSDTSGGPAIWQASPQDHAAGERVSTTPAATLQRPDFVPRNPSGIIQFSDPALGQLKGSSIKARNTYAGNSVQSTAPSITSDREVSSQATAQSSGSVALDQTRPPSSTTAAFQPDHSVSTTGIVSVSDIAVSLLAQPITQSAIARLNHTPAIDAPEGFSADLTHHAEQYPDIHHMGTSDPSRTPIVQTSNPQPHGSQWQTNPPGTTRDKAPYDEVSGGNALSYEHPLQVSTKSNQQVAVGVGCAPYRQPSTLESSSHQHRPHLSSNPSYAHRRMSDMESANRVHAYGYPPMLHHLVERDISIARNPELSHSLESPQRSRNSNDTMRVSAIQFSTNPTSGIKAYTPQSDPQWANSFSRQDNGPVRMPNYMDMDYKLHNSPQLELAGPHSARSDTNHLSTSRKTIREQSQSSATSPDSYTAPKLRNSAATTSAMVSGPSHMSPHIGMNGSGMPVQSLLDSNQAGKFSLQSSSLPSTSQAQPPAMTHRNLQTGVNVPDIRQGNHPVNMSVQSTTSTSRTPPPVDASNQGNVGTAPDMVYSDISSKAQMQSKKRSIPTYTGTARPPLAPTVKSNRASEVGTKRRNSSGTRTTRISNSPQTDITSAGQPAQQPGARKVTVKPAAKKQKTTRQSPPPTTSHTAGTIFNGQQASKAANKNDIGAAQILQLSLSETNQVGTKSRQTSELETTTKIPIPQDMTNPKAINTAFNLQNMALTELVSQEKRSAMPSIPAASKAAPQDRIATDVTKRAVLLPPRKPTDRFKIVEKKSSIRNAQSPTNAKPQFHAIVDTAPTSRTARLNNKTVSGQPNPTTRTRSNLSGPAIIESSGGSQEETSAATSNSMSQSSKLITTTKPKPKPKPKAATVKSQELVALAAVARTVTIPGQSTTRAQSKVNKANTTAKPALRRLQKSTGASDNLTGMAKPAVAAKDPSKEALAKGKAKPVVPRGRKGAV